MAEPLRIRLCGASEVPEGSVRRFETQRGPVALARCSAGLRGVLDICSHEDYPLSEGEVFPDTCEIECLRHGSTFSLLDGSPQSLPATKPVTLVEIELDGDDAVAVFS